MEVENELYHLDSRQSKHESWGGKAHPEPSQNKVKLNACTN
jgi:hypothetical protein